MHYNTKDFDIKKFLNQLISNELKNKTEKLDEIIILLYTLMVCYDHFNFL